MGCRNRNAHDLSTTECSLWRAGCERRATNRLTTAAMMHAMTSRQRVINPYATHVADLAPERARTSRQRVINPGQALVGRSGSRGLTSFLGGIGQLAGQVAVIGRHIHQAMAREIKEDDLSRVFLAGLDRFIHRSADRMG